MRKILSGGVVALLLTAGLVAGSAAPAVAVDLVRSGVGVFRPSEHRFYLDKDHNGSSELDVSFGQTGDVPLSGTFGVLGFDGIGVYRPSTSTFYLDYRTDGQANGNPIPLAPPATCRWWGTGITSPAG